MRFRLRSLLIVVAIIAALFAGVVVPIQQCRHDRAIVAELKARHGGNSVLIGTMPCWYSGLAKKLGFSPVERVTLIDLQHCTGVSDADLKTVAKLPNLLAFNLWYRDFHFWYPQDAESRITDAGIEHLVPCSRLAWLNLAGSEITDAGLVRIGRFTQLRGLGLYGMPRITDRGIANPSSLTHLQGLDLSGSSVTGLEHGFISPQCPLTHLNLQNTKLTDEGLKVIASFKSLRHLDLGGTAVTDEGLKSLEGLSLLEKLQLYDTQITDKGLASLGKLPLINLSLHKMAVSEQGIEQLTNIPTLRNLTLSSLSQTTSPAALLAPYHTGASEE
jgi:internalin A